MPKTRIVVAEPQGADTAGATDLLASFEALREEYGLTPTYPQPAVDDALAAIAAASLPERDETAVPFFTIDPAGSMDLDQAMHLEADGDGFHVRYAIADVPLYVRPSGALDAETRKRGETVYMPDMRIPLHPKELSENAGSLLPGQVRSAFVWDMHLDATGEVTHATVYRAKVKSVERLDYTGVQGAVDSGESDERFALLKRIGELRAQLELARGGASLPMPEQEVTPQADGTYVVHFRPPVPSEDWNAQISLMTGMVAAQMMLDGGIGILRTMPKADPRDVERFRRQAQALSVPWPQEQTYGAFLRSLDRTNPKHLSLIHEAVTLFRGAAYTPFDGAAPAEREQAAVAAPYAHVTAPLRRLVDRFGLVICAALSSGTPVPDWVREALPELPEIMRRCDQLAGKVDRACVDRVEAAVLASHVGETFDAFVVDGGDQPSAQSTTPTKAIEQPAAAPGMARSPQSPKPRTGKITVQLVDHAVVAMARRTADGPNVEAGQPCSVKLVTADVATGVLEFEVVATL